MQKYYIETQLTDSVFSKKDSFSVIFIIILVLFSAFLLIEKTKANHIKVIEPYYQERFYKVPSKQSRFANKKYDIASSKLLLNDHVRRLKYKFKDLNKSLSSFQSDLLKQQAMNDIILMLRKVKSGDLKNFDMEKMQQAVLEAGYGNIDKKLLEKALDNYNEKVEQDDIIKNRLEAEKRKTEEKIENDSKEAAVLAKDIAREIAEDEIEGFIENLSILARVGHFVIQKVNNE